VVYYHLVVHKQLLCLLLTLCIVYCFNLSPRRTCAEMLLLCLRIDHKPDKVRKKWFNRIVRTL
jgi:hypothetical protein